MNINVKTTFKQSTNNEIKCPMSNALMETSSRVPECYDSSWNPGLLAGDTKTK